MFPRFSHSTNSIYEFNHNENSNIFSNQNFEIKKPLADNNQTTTKYKKKRNSNKSLINTVRLYESLQIKDIIKRLLGKRGVNDIKNLTKLIKKMIKKNLISVENKEKIDLFISSNSKKKLILLISDPLFIQSFLTQIKRINT